MRVTSYKSKVHVGWTRCNLAAYKCPNDKRLPSVFVWPVCRLLAISGAGVFVFTGVSPLRSILWSVNYLTSISSCYSESSILSLGMVIFYIYAIFRVLLTPVSIPDYIHEFLFPLTSPPAYYSQDLANPILFSML